MTHSVARVPPTKVVPGFHPGYEAAAHGWPVARVPPGKEALP